MHPILFESEFFILPSWHVFFVLGTFALFITMEKLRHIFDSSFPQELLSKTFLLAYLGAYFGARGFSIYIEETPRTFFDFFEKLLSLGPLTFYGGFFGAVFASLLVLRSKDFILRTLDLALPAMFFGLFFGRIGCFLNGCDFGIVVHEDSILAVNFQNHGYKVTRLPVQLFESFMGLIFGSFLIFLRTSFGSFKKGRLGLLGLTLYALGRFFLEFLRGDSRGHLIFESLSTSQTLSLGLLVLIPFLWSRTS